MKSEVQNLVMILFEVGLRSWLAFCFSCRLEYKDQYILDGKVFQSLNICKYGIIPSVVDGLNYLKFTSLAQNPQTTSSLLLSKTNLCILQALSKSPLSDIYVLLLLHVSTEIF